MQLCLRGDLQVRFEEFERELAEAHRRDESTYAGGAAAEVAAQMEALRKQMEEASVTFRLRSLGKMRPLELLAENPPRDGDKMDHTLGYNQATYYTALVQQSCFEVAHADGTVLAVSELDETEWEQLFAALSHKQFDSLVGAAIAVNDRDVAVPFSHHASLISQRSGGDSKQPGPGTSAQRGSTGGSRPKKRRSSSTTTKAVRADG